MLAYLFAVLAACANATSSVMQRAANRRLPSERNLSVKLIWSLLHEPVWFCGVGALCAGFGLQVAALRFGPLTLVEPILVVELPLTLLVASRVFRHRLGRREWAVIVAMTAGLAGLLYSLSPRGSGTAVTSYRWAGGIGANLALIAVGVWWARRYAAGERRAALLGAAGGSAFGLTAALMKGMTREFADGAVAVLTGWQVYAMVAAGLLGMFLTQSALNAGQLIAAQPGLTLMDPAVSVLWGVLVYGEQVRTGAFIIAEVACAVVTAAAVVALARSPLLGT